MNTRRLLWLCMLITLSPISILAQTTKIADIFTDHLVLQRHSPISIWGTGTSGNHVIVSLNNIQASTLVQTDGKWMVKLPPMSAGGPYKLEVTGGNKITLNDILIGDVWLASGQSNMEWKMGNNDSPINNQKEEITNANYPQIRFITVKQFANKKPQTNLHGEKWQVCSPTTVGDMSATSYFFARHLHKEKNVPIGVIVSAWGGTIAEAWASKEALLPLEMFNWFLLDTTEVNQTHSVDELIAEFKVTFLAAGDQLEKNEKGLSLGYASTNFDDSQWKSLELPGMWEQQGLPNYDGNAWIRKEITLTKDQAGKALTLHLGKVDDSDITYFNGVQVGKTTGYARAKDTRTYTVPANLVKEGKNVISILIIDIMATGGISETDELELRDATNRIISNLKGTWKYKTSFQAPYAPLIYPQGGWKHNNPALLFNGLINPVIPYGLKGFIWYQGESNTGYPEKYAKTMPALLNDWRIRFGQGYLPFLYVQLANFKDETNWAPLREVQSNLLTYNNTGMAVAIDIGNPDNIHPSNKQDVGKRLALAAQKVAYGDQLVYSGPIYDSMRVEGNRIRVFFKHASTGLTSTDKLLSGFEIASNDQPFVTADAIIEGNTVLVNGAGILNPTKVRYGWASSPKCTLYNKEGLPASPFRTYK